jgi:hypothetical protein
LQNGTTTVFAKGKMIAIKGSEYSTSFGDEPGTLGGVTSSTFKKETAWITYSFDVKLDGANACRHTDKKFHNHKNTVDLAGNIDPALLAMGVQALQAMVCECDDQVVAEPDDTCPTLGAKKHECMNNKISQHRPPPKLQGEVAYNRATGQPATPPSTRQMLIGEPIFQFFRRIRGNIYPDATIMDNYGRPAQFAEFKFQCPSPVPIRRGGPPSTGTAPQGWSDGQRDRTVDLGSRQDPPVTEEPALITNEACP